MPLEINNSSSTKPVIVPLPTPISKTSGIIITDYIYGNGKEPKAGSKIKVIYQGMYPNGKIFDTNLKIKKPLIFRKGLGEVVRGLDHGIEGMRIGGSREVIVPPELG